MKTLVLLPSRSARSSARRRFPPVSSTRRRIRSPIRATRSPMPTKIAREGAPGGAGRLHLPGRQRLLRRWSAARGRPQVGDILTIPAGQAYQCQQEHKREHGPFGQCRPHAADGESVRQAVQPQRRRAVGHPDLQGQGRRRPVQCAFRPDHPSPSPRFFANGNLLVRGQKADSQPGRRICPGFSGLIRQPGHRPGQPRAFHARCRRPHHLHRQGATIAARASRVAGCSSFFSIIDPSDRVTRFQ